MGYENLTSLPKGYDTIDLSRFRGKKNKKSPLEIGIASLMVRDEEMKTKSGVERKNEIPVFKLKKISDIISNNIQAQTDLRSITPYIKRAEQIWLTLLLKPNGIQEQILEYDTYDSELKNTKLHRELSVIVENYFTNNYPLEEKLPQIIKDVMFRTGSYILLNMSHSALDHLINGMDVGGAESIRGSVRTLEKELLTKEFAGSFSKPLNRGYVRSKKVDLSNEGFESLYRDRKREPEFNLVDDFFKWTLTDNPLVLKVSSLKQKIIDSRLEKTTGMESLEGLVRTSFVKDGKRKGGVNNNYINMAEKTDYNELLDKMYPHRNYRQKDQLSVRSSKFYSGSGKGIGITYHPPSESCITVNNNGDIGNPFGYIFLLDPETGDFLKTTQDFKFYSSSKNRTKVDNKNKSGSINSIISNLKTVANGSDCDFDMDWMIDIASSELEKQLLESIINGDKGGNVTISLTEANKKLFFSRAMYQQGVRCLFIPAEYVTYFAIDYNQLGVGKSLVDEAKTIIMRIAMLDIADTIANMENAISKTLLSITTEDEDGDWENTLAQVKDNYLSNNPSLINFFGFYNIPIDTILDGVKNSLVRIKHTNAGTAGINIEIDEEQDRREGIKPVPQESRDQAFNSLASFFDLKRSHLEDSDQGNDFAVEVLAEQELLRNTTIERSKLFSLHISDFVSKHIRCNEYLLKELIDTIKENKKLYEKPDQGGKLLEDSKEKDEGTKVLAVLTDFLNNIKVSLPIPTTIESFNKLVDKIDAADKLVNAWKEMGVASAIFANLEEMISRSEIETRFKKEEIVDVTAAILKREAFKRFNLPMPYDEVVADGKSGGIMSYMADITAMYDNSAAFLDEYLKTITKADTKIESVLKKHLPKENPDGNEFGNNDTPPDEFGDSNNDDTPDEFKDPDDMAEELNSDTPSEETDTEETKTETTTTEKTETDSTEETGSAGDIAADLDSGLNF